MKKKIIALSLVAVMALVAITGATLAYFTDTDVQTNTFTVGNVAIDLWEDFGGNTGVETLIPATGSAQQGTLQNGVTKKVYVDNTGSEEAYVRVHIAIPQILDNGADTFDAGKNVLHFNFADDSIGAGKWDWSKAADDGQYQGNWNYYETTIKGIDYNVYVVTYTKVLNAGEKTIDAMNQVYLDSKVTNADITRIKETLGENWHILVVAEGCQADGFADAYSALNAAFGVPGSYTVDFSGAAEGKTFKENSTVSVSDETNND